MMDWWLIDDLMFYDLMMIYWWLIDDWLMIDDWLLIDWFYKFCTLSYLYWLWLGPHQLYELKGLAVKLFCGYLQSSFSVSPPNYLGVDLQ